MDNGILGESHGSVLAPDGVYTGVCSGYRVRYKRNGQEYEFELVKGIRENDVPVKIVIRSTKANIYRV
jgi:hypothetical protein